MITGAVISDLEAIVPLAVHAVRSPWTAPSTVVSSSHRPVVQNQAGHSAEVAAVAGE